MIKDKVFEILEEWMENGEDPTKGSPLMLAEDLIRRNNFLSHYAPSQLEPYVIQWRNEQ